MSNHQFIQGEVKPLLKRDINEDTCKRFRYETGRVPKDYPAREGTQLHDFKGKLVQIENFYEDGQLVGQKLRDKDKNFAAIGNVSKMLWGKHAVKAGSSKVLVITEGAIDAMSYSQMRKGWPAVSVPNGAESAVGAVKANVEWLETFETVVLCFDNDEAGQKAVEACKGLLSPKKMKIANLPGQYKDLNEALMSGDWKAALEAVFQAEEVKPDGLVRIADVLEEAKKPVEMGLPWFIPELTKLTYGRRYGEVYGLGAGTGVGKTDILTEQIKLDIVDLGLPVGILMLEQKPAETVKRVAGKVANRRFHVPDSGWTVEELEQACETLGQQVMLYDSFGETEWTKIKAAIRHMAVAEGIRIFYLDHLTAMADTNDEKGSIEQIMKEMAGLANELGIIIHFVSHLTTPDGTPHEEGGRVMIRHFKGSRSIGFWSFFMFGLERDQQSEDEEERHTTTFRVLKDRYTGQATGHTIELGYDPEIGRIIIPAARGFDDITPEDMTEGF